jgi:hypothetical protein
MGCIDLLKGFTAREEFRIKKRGPTILYLNPNEKLAEPGLDCKDSWQFVYPYSKCLK